MCAGMCYKSGMFGAGTTLVTCDPCPYYTFVLGVRGHKLMELVSTAEVDSNREAAAKADTEAIWEQQLKQMQSGSSS